MSRKPVVTLVTSVALSLAIVVTMWWFLPGEPRPTQVSRAEPGVNAASGVRASDYSPARRLNREPAIEDAAPLPEVAPEDEPEPIGVPERRSRPVESEPAVPLVVTEEMEATQAAYEERRASIAAEVGAQLARQQSALRSACWTSELRGSVEAASFMVSASFDPDGKPLSVGISEQRAGPGVAGAPGVGQCVRAHGVELGDVSPGSSVTVEVPLTLP